VLKKYIDNLGLFLGVIGLLLFIFGLTEHNIDNKNLVVLLATFMLFASALIQKEQFFMGLQGIAFVSAIMVFYETDQNYNLITFITLAFIFAITYFSKHKLNLARVCAFVGLIALCLGILLGRNEPMMICGVFLAVYAIFSISEGYSVGWVFLILNILFAVVAANSLYGFY
jgi:hypothetical protein